MTRTIVVGDEFMSGAGDRYRVTSVADYDPTLFSCAMVLRDGSLRDYVYNGIQDHSSYQWTLSAGNRPDPNTKHRVVDV